MKTQAMAALAVALLAGQAGAWEVRDNPDRYISVGVHADVEHLSGTHSNVLDPGPNEVVQMETAGSNLSVAGFDVRLPLFKQVTFTVSYDKLTLDAGNVREGDTFEAYDHRHGNRVDFGMRLYLCK